MRRIKNIVTEIKTLLFIRRLDMAEKRISVLEDILIEPLENKDKKKKRQRKKKPKTTGKQHIQKNYHTLHEIISKGEKKKK